MAVAAFSSEAQVTGSADSEWFHMTASVGVSSTNALSVSALPHVTWQPTTDTTEDVRGDAWWLEGSLGGIELAAQRVKGYVRQLWPRASFAAVPLRVPASRHDAPVGDALAALTASLAGASPEEARAIRRKVYAWLAEGLAPVDRARLTVTILSG